MNQENKKYTIQEFGSIIKQKYPQYSSYADDVIGKETLVNHPEYQSKIATPTKQSSLSSFFNQPQDPVSKYAGGAIKDAFSSGINQIKAGHQQFQNATNPVQAVEGVTNGLAGVVNTAFSPVAPITKPIEMGVNYVGDKISNSPKVQKFAESPAGKLTSRVVGDISNVNTIAGAVAPLVGASMAKANAAKIAKAESAFKRGGTTANTVEMHDTYIKNGDFLPSDVYQTPGGIKIYKPEVAQQIVSDGVNYMKSLGLNDLADKYQSSFGDFSKVTPKQVLQNGLNTLSQKSSGSIPMGMNSFSEGINEKPIGTAGSFASNVIKDVTPTADRVVNYAVTQALDLTPGDLKNIQFSTGNAVGEFMADRNLIGNNKDVTIKNLNNFSKLNYDAVRAEINKVDKTYNNVPRYKEALTAIKTTIQDVPGLQEAGAEVDALLKIKKPTLANVQRVKELMDEHFSLYKATGDVKDSAAKEGLANIRDDLKTFIENRVEEETGADIRALNNNVQTAKSIIGAVEERNTRGLTRSMLRLGDLGVFGMGMGFGGPLVGAAAVFAKKLIASPTALLTFSKWADSLSDAAKARVKTNLEAGIPPKGFQDSSSQPTNLMTDPNSTPTTNLNANSIEPNGSIPSEGSQGGMKMPNVINPQDTSTQNKQEEPTLLEDIKKNVKKFFGINEAEAQTKPLRPEVTDAATNSIRSDKETIKLSKPDSDTWQKVILKDGKIETPGVKNLRTGEIVPLSKGDFPYLAQQNISNENGDFLVAHKGLPLDSIYNKDSKGSLISFKDSSDLQSKYLEPGKKLLDMIASDKYFEPMVGHGGSLRTPLSIRESMSALKGMDIEKGLEMVRKRLNNGEETQAGAPRDNGILQPDGRTLYGDGSYTWPDGRIDLTIGPNGEIYDNGTRIDEKGLPWGTKYDDDGNPIFDYPDSPTSPKYLNLYPGKTGDIPDRYVFKLDKSATTTPVIPYKKPAEKGPSDVFFSNLKFLNK